jgi:esterase/lipase superfamily enzyme
VTTVADVTERWFSDRIQQEITVMRWGSFGTPVLVFPSAGGDAGEIERHGLVDACGPLLNRVDNWGPGWPHQWHTWRQMLPQYLRELT